MDRRKKGDGEGKEAWGEVGGGERRKERRKGKGKSREGKAQEERKGKEEGKSPLP